MCSWPITRSITRMTKNFHWNVTGRTFFELYEKFEALYTDSREKIDLIAERILALGFQPKSNLSDYLALSEVQESAADLSDQQMMAALLGDCSILAAQTREALKRAGEASDEGTIDLLGGLLGELEKTAWMFHAWLGNSAPER